MIRTIALFYFDGNCISAYSFCTFFTPKFTKNANLRINFYKKSPLFEENVWLNKIKKLYLQQIYAGIHKINEDGYKNTANIRDGTQ